MYSDVLGSVSWLILRRTTWRRGVLAFTAEPACLEAAGLDWRWMAATSFCLCSILILMSVWMRVERARAQYMHRPLDIWFSHTQLPLPAIFSSTTLLKCSASCLSAKFIPTMNILCIDEMLHVTRAFKITACSLLTSPGKEWNKGVCFLYVNSM